MRLFPAQTPVKEDPLLANCTMQSVRCAVVAALHAPLQQYSILVYSMQSYRQHLQVYRLPNQSEIDYFANSDYNSLKKIQIAKK